MPSKVGRRRFLSTLASAYALSTVRPSPASTVKDLIEGIAVETPFPGRKLGMTWFHPRPCVLPSGNGPTVLMTMQTIQGSDNFGPVHWTSTSDLGKTWSKPTPIPGFERREFDKPNRGKDLWEEGVCDVVPEYHHRTNSVLAMGHNVFYKNNVLARPQLERAPVYAVRTQEGTWIARGKLEWDDPRATEIYTCGCAQRATLDNGDILVPISFGAKGNPLRSVTTLLCEFRDQRLSVRSAGVELKGTSGRGLLEPSLASWRGKYYLTIRAEDGRGYVTSSDDGLNWETLLPWCWEDGKPLDMSTTQQRWLSHSDGLYLVYTRRAEENADVFRWRGPIFLARMDARDLRLQRETERIVFPLRWETPKDPQHVARMGNFHTVAVTPNESWITVGEEYPTNHWRGDTLLARVRWQTPNANATIAGS